MTWPWAWLRRRRFRDDSAVITVLGARIPMSYNQLLNLTGLTPSRLSGALDRLCDSGRVRAALMEVDSLTGARRRVYLMPQIEGRRADLLIIEW